MNRLNGKTKEVLDACLSSESPEVKAKVYEIINVSGLEADDPMFLILALTGQMRVFLEAAPAELSLLLTESQFLAQAGFASANWQALKIAIQELNQSVEAVRDRTNEYGTFYNVYGELKGVNGVNLSSVTVWLKRQSDGKFQFITLKPGD